ncbi:hypothetical protein [Cognatiyoonia koreensis]|nr:hypothetical protein [Cognatiyoonia koreensis]
METKDQFQEQDAPERPLFPLSPQAVRELRTMPPPVPTDAAPGAQTVYE